METLVPFALRGSGGMAKAVAGALHGAGHRRGIILAGGADAEMLAFDPEVIDRPDRR